MKIGIDIEEIERFKNKTVENDSHFLERIFTEKEISYCFSKTKPAQHLCARFCAKEAVIKALSDKTLELNEIEILNNEDGKPLIRLPEKYKTLIIDVSISHCKKYACANVLLYQKN